MIDIEQPVGEEQAARLIGCKRTGLANLRKTGRGPRFYRVGWLIRYRPSDLREFIERNTHDPASAGKSDKVATAA